MLKQSWKWNITFTERKLHDHIKNSSLKNENQQRTRMQHEVNIASGQVVKMKQAAMAAAAEFTWSNAALQYEAVFQELGVKDVLNGHLA